MRLKNVKGANEIIEKGIYYVDDPSQFKGKWSEYFGNNNPIYVEIGMGKGDFIIQNALKYKDINFIGIEKYDSVIVRAIQKSNELEINNLKIVRIDANKLESIFGMEVDTIYLNFSDPWPKDRHSKRRLTSSVFLNIYDKIFKDRERIVMKTDNLNLFEFSLESLANHGYDIVYKTNNLDCLSEDNIMTEYENRFYNLGVKINKLEAIRQKQDKC